MEMKTLLVKDTINNSNKIYLEQEHEIEVKCTESVEVVRIEDVVLLAFCNVHTHNN